jgi:hypothetical protein
MTIFLKKHIYHYHISKKYLSLSYFKKTYLSLRSSDCPLPKAYALPKIHKKDIPFRIIVSSINSTLYKFAAYLHKILFDNLPQCDSYVKNSTELYNKLLGKQIDRNNVLVSLDVNSLFTNVPSDLAGIKTRWLLICNNTRIPLTEFLLAIQFVLSSTYFTFGNVIFKQIFGMPMGSPLSPILADIVMQDLEKKALNSLNFDVQFYYRYVDDIILSLPRTQKNILLEKFNDVHNRLQFTIEEEKNRCINFLDVSLLVSDDRIIIDWFHKETFSGRYLSYLSNHPLCHKVGTIYSLVDRAILLSHPTFHQKNLEFVVDTLLKNSYPINLIFEKVRKRLKFLTTNRRNNGVEIEDNGETNKKIIVLPYIHNVSEMVTSAFNKKEVMIGYRVLNKLTGFIKRHKDETTVDSSNNVVYKICCKDCDASYVGQTKRQLKTRLNEHIKNSSLNTLKHTVITEHTLEYNHTFDWQNKKILDFETNYYKRLISEMIHIKLQTNGINCMEDTDLLDSGYSNLLSKL